jgi:methionine sulfoxide reductase catalytic subunit
MFVKTKRGWEISESAVTPEHLVVTRRKLLEGAGTGAFALGLVPAALSIAVPRIARADDALTPDPRFQPGRAITAERDATTYNNYYEFSEDKDLWQAAQKLPISPWSIRIEGEVDTPRTIAFEDLMKQVKLEERIYRHRCVEAWAMTVPWTGFQLSELLKIARPKPSAKYIVFQTDENEKAMPGLSEPWYPWPYIEGLTMAEAANELAFIVTGLYGKPLPKQNGAPIRLVTPWKYGFKSAKALVKVSFTEKRPTTFWQAIQPDEYGFWANVNPAVPHPRWSQATERLLGSDERVPTQIYNGYGAFVASLYTNLTNEKLYM